MVYAFDEIAELSYPLKDTIFYNDLFVMETSILGLSPGIIFSCNLQ